MYILNNETQITTSLNYNKWLKRFDTLFNEPTNQNTTKVPKENYIIKLWGLVK